MSLFPPSLQNEKRRWKRNREKRGVTVFLCLTTQIILVQHTAKVLTSGVSAKDELSDFIVNKDEEAVWEGAEPPAGPERRGGNDKQQEEK